MKYEKIICGNGPEDIGLESNSTNKRLIISCTTRKGKKLIDGGLWFFALDNNTQAVKFTLKNYSEEKIRPHGIYVLNHKDNASLYVISHEDYDKILKFNIQGDQLVFEKEWSGKYYTFFNAINDLFVTKNEYIYVTNPGPAKLKKKKGTVFLLKPNNQFHKIIDDVYYPNGILLKDNKLYLTTFRGNTLNEYLVLESGEVDSEPISKTKLKSGDNITLHNDELIIATHPNKLKFVFHALFKFKSPSSVYSYNLNSKKLERIFHDNGKIISGSSTALKIGNELYISQVFNNFLLKVYR